MSSYPASDIKTRRVAILIAPGIDGAMASSIYSALIDAGAVPRFVAAKLGEVKAGKLGLHAEISIEAGPAALYDAMVVPDGADGVAALLKDGNALEFIKDQYRHCKPMLMMGAAAALLEKAGIPLNLPNEEKDPFIVGLDQPDAGKATKAFIAAMTGHKEFGRETDPPAV